ncbi:hypothetical protein MTR_1638s0010, partial [Medicago truncatula]
MCWALKESQKNGRRQIPFGRLLSEIFVQGKLLKYLRETGVSSDEELGTVVEKIINGKTLRSMKLIDDVVSSKEDLAVETVQSDLMTDFPSISKEDNHEVLYQFIKAHFELTGTIISVASIPEKIGGAPLKVKGKRSRKESKVDVVAPKPKKSKVVVSASEEVHASEGDVQKQKNKKSDAGEATLQTIRSKKTRNLKTAEGRKEEYTEQLLENWEEESSPKKAKRTNNAEPIVMPSFKASEDQLQYAREYAASKIAERKQMKKQFEKERDERLKAAGYELAPEKAAEMAALAAELEQETVQQGAALLSQDLKKKHASGATSLEPASKAPEAANPEAHSSGTSSKAKINNQIPDLPSTESDDIP